MKKFYFCILLFLVCISTIKASSGNVGFSVIDLQFHYSSVANGVSVSRPRVPAHLPRVYQDGYVIFFEVEDFCNSVTIIDMETEEVVYETSVLDSENQIELPQYLQGEYEIRFNRDSYYFSGIIQL